MKRDRDLGLFPLDMVLLPGERAPLHIFEPRYRQLVADTTLEDQPFVLVHTKDGRTATVGCSARFTALVRRFSDGRLSLIAQGESPVELLEETEARLYYSALVRALDDDPVAPDPATLTNAERAFRAVTGIEGELPVTGDVPTSYALAGALGLPVASKQRLLDSRVESDRLAFLTELLDDVDRGQRRARSAAARAQGNGKVSSP